MGAAVNALPGRGDRSGDGPGLLDAAEFNNASSDRALGFADVSKVCMLQSYHQNAEQFEILFNKTKFDGLPAKLRARSGTRWRRRRPGHVVEGDPPLLSKDYIELQTKDKVRFYRTPDSVLQKQLEAIDQVEAKKSAENPYSKRLPTRSASSPTRVNGTSTRTFPAAWPITTISPNLLPSPHAAGKRRTTKANYFTMSHVSIGQPSGSDRMTGIF